MKTEIQGDPLVSSEPELITAPEWCVQMTVAGSSGCDVCVFPRLMILAVQLILVLYNPDKSTLCATE